MSKLLSPPIFTDPDAPELTEDQVGVFIHNAHIVTQPFVRIDRRQMVTDYILALIEEEFFKEDLESGYITPKELVFVFAYLAKMIWGIRREFAE